MAKHRVPVTGTIGKSILVDDSLGGRVEALEEAIRALILAGPSRHSSLQGLQAGNDHPQYPLKQGRETISGQWDFRLPIWASFGTEAAPGYSFLDLPNSGIFATDNENVGDPFWEDVVLLAQVDEAGVMTDNSPVGAVKSVVGGGSVTSAVQIFGRDSFDNPGNGTSDTNYLQFTAPAGTYYFPGEFTLEGWFHIDSMTATYNDYYSNDVHFPTATFYAAYYTSLAYGINAVSASGTAPSGSSTTPTLGAPLHHFAVTRDAGGIVRTFINGVKTLTTAAQTGAMGAANATLIRIGSGNSSIPDNGDSNFHCGELRVTKACRYTDDFAVPTAAFPNFIASRNVLVSVDGDEKFRFTDLGQLGIGGANFGTARQSLLSGGAFAPPAWSTLVHTDISDWDEAVQDTVGLMLADSTSIDFTYSDAGGTFTASTINANPSGLIGMTAVDGTAATPLRSDGRHAIDPAITPEWTGNHGWADTKEVQLGTGNDLRLYHDGADSWVNNDTGNLNFDTPGDFNFTVGTIITAASATTKAGLRLPHGSAPTTPTNGDLWTTTAGLFVRVNGATVALGSGGSIALDDLSDVTITTPLSGNFLKYNGTVWVNGAGAIVYSAYSATSNTVVSTAAETPFASQYTFDAATQLVAGSTIQLRARGVYGTDSAAPTLRVKVKLDSTVILDTTAITATASMTNRGWALDALIQVVASGGGGSVEAQGNLSLSSGAKTVDSAFMSNTAAVSKDLSADTVLSITAQWGTSDSDNTITLRQMVISQELVPAVALPVTWDTTTQAGNIALTNGNLTAARISGSGSWVSVRANKGVSTGKYYWEVKTEAGATTNNLISGVGSSSLSQSSYVGSDSTSYGFHSSGGGPLKYNNAASTSYGTAVAAGDTLCIALDMDNGKIWFGKNGTWMASGDPAAGTNPSFSSLSGTKYPATSNFGTGSSVTARFASTDWVYAAPTGFIALTL